MREEGGGRREEGAARQQELWESSVFSRKGESDEVKSAGQIYMNVPDLRPAPQRMNHLQDKLLHCETVRGQMIRMFVLWL